MVNFQICKKCGEEKSISDFSIYKKENDRIFYRKKCKICRKPLYTARYKKNHEKELNRFKIYREKNHDIILIKSREYYKNNSESEKERTQKYKTNNRDADRIYSRQYYRGNKKLIIQKQIIRAKNKRLKDPQFRLRDNISKHINSSLKRKGWSKMGESIFTHLPYTLQALKQHIESQFEPWMNWNNYGKYELNKWKDNDSSTWVWNIDHIIPQCKFNYISMEDEEFKKCWALENLKPISAKQNLIKGGKYHG